MRKLIAIPASRREVETRPLVRVPHVLISIRDPGSRKPRLFKHGLRRDTLFVEFHDAEPLEGFTLPPEIKLMTPKHAAKIWAFVLKHIGVIGAVVVHCEQGMSRSPAVAAGILTGLGLDASELMQTFQPNAYVLRLMLDGRPRM
jgi:predicted protein tyrosine phosphatase